MTRHSIAITTTATLALTLCALGLVAERAHAFCGFYVAGADAQLYNNATMVVMMRDGTRTVLSMQNNYEGPPQDFAMVVPVPVVLQKENVKTLPNAVFDRVDQLASPRLVEYWEQDPCNPQPDGGAFGFGGLGTRGRGGGGGGYGVGGLGTVKIEAQFEVGEYEIVILSAKDSTGLARWLELNKYNIPKGADAAMAPYVESGMYFFVARVNAKKVTFKDGQATLSPLRFHYESKDFSLPVRLGLLNAKGKQDLLVHILAHQQRYEVANAKNVLIPTNVLVKPETKARFGEFYAALFDDTLAQNPGAVVTEYSWGSSSCDPCPGPTLTAADLTTLGLDVVRSDTSRVVSNARLMPPARIKTSGLDPGIIHRVTRRRLRAVQHCHSVQLATDAPTSGKVALEYTINPRGTVEGARVNARASTAKKLVGLTPCIERVLKRMKFPAPSDGKPIAVKQTLELATRPASWGGASSGWVLTRLHARYDADDLKDDLVFKAADPISGGRGTPAGAEGKILGSTPSGENTYQGRYIMLHPWEGEMSCTSPSRGRWGGKPASQKAGTDGMGLGLGSGASPPPKIARNVAFAPRGKLKLDQFIGAGVATVKIDAKPEAAPKLEAEVPPTDTKAPAPAAPPRSNDGCAQAPTQPSAALWGLVVFGMLALAGTRRRRS